MVAIADPIRISAFSELIDPKEVIDWADECCAIDRGRDQAFLKRIIALNRDSLGIKKSESPFNTHKKITEKYIKEVFGISDEQITSFASEGMSALGPKIVRVFVDSAQSVDNKSGKQCNPYFKLFLKTYCRDNKLVFASKPFVSHFILKTSNPKWATNLDIEVPDSVTDLSDQLRTKVYRHDIVIEIWCKNLTVSCVERTLNRFVGYEFDDYLGSVELTIGKRSSLDDFFTYHIPSTPSFQKLSLSEESNSSVSLKTVWGRRWASAPAPAKPLHQIFLKHHILLYITCFEWYISHLHLPDKSNDLYESLKSEDLSYLTFLPMPSVSLLNQHKIQSNLSTYEDSILRRIVLLNLVIKYKIGSNESQIKYSLLLAKLLANEDIKRKAFTAWLSKQFVLTLNQIERQFLLKLIDHTNNELKLLTQKSMEGENSDSLPLRRLLYILKGLRKYHRKYRDLNIKQTINALIGKQIIEWIKKNLDSKDWSKIISFLAILAEHLRDYWYRLETIVNYQEIQTILMELRKGVEDMINRWKEDKQNETLSEEILEFFLFLTQLNQFFSKHDKEMSELETFDKTTTLSDEQEVEPQKQSKPIEQYLKQIKVKDIKRRPQKKITFNDLKFSQFLRANEFESILFWKGFDREIFDHWIRKREQSLESFVRQMVERYKNLIETGTEEEIKEPLDGRIATKFFFNAMSQLIYFSLAVTAKHNWNFEKFTDIVNKLCTICYQFCDHLKDKICLESNEKQNNYLLLNVFVLNALELMQRKHLRTDLLEVITDIDSTRVTKILSQTPQQSIRVDQKTNQFETPSEVFKHCKFIQEVADEIQEMQIAISDHLSDQIAKQYFNCFAEIITNSSDQSVCESKAKSLDLTVDKGFQIISENVIQRQMICDILLKSKIKTEKVIITQLEHISQLSKQIETNSESGTEFKAKHEKVEKFYSYLDSIFKDSIKKMNQFLTKLHIEDKSINQLKNYV